MEQFETTVRQQLPVDIMKKAVRGMIHIAHPLRLRILEYLDVYGPSCVGHLTREMGEEQAVVSQSLRKMKDAGLVKSQRRGLFIYYSVCEEYPASVFVCLRKLYGIMTDNFAFLQDGFKALLPKDYTLMSANRVKLFANFDKMRILEYLLLKGPQNVTQIMQGINCEQAKTSQYLKRLKEDCFVSSCRCGRCIVYEITKGVHKTCLECIHKRYNSLKNKEDF
jgi:DNA-binding transcriptional ArsR family regulator/predicted transcriptional regulator